MKTTFATLFSALVLAATSLTSQAQVIWNVGSNDNAQAVALRGGGPNTAFVQETGVISPLPGNPFNVPTVPASQSADNDYYFAGIYSNVISSVTAFYAPYAPVGVVSTNEEAAERAFAGGDNDLRYHFNLPSSLSSTSLLSVTLDAFSLDTGVGNTNPRYGVEVYFNGVLVQTQLLIRPPQIGIPYTSPQFTLASVNAQTGPGFDNIISLKGYNYGATAGGQWMGFDYVQLNAPTNVVPPLVIPDGVFPWGVGKDDNTHSVAGNNGGGTNAAFTQEGGGVNPLPGNPFNVPTVPATQSADNDYYFAGLYTTTIASVTNRYGTNYTPVGLVSTNEEAAQRAFAGTDNDLRYHFNLPQTAAPTDLVSVSFDPLDLDTAAANTDPRYGVEIYFNGVLVQPQTIIRPAQLGKKFSTLSFSLASVNAAIGPGFDNIVTLRGTNYSATGGGNWMGIDYVTIERGFAIPAAVLPWSVGRNDNDWPAGDGGGTNATFVAENGISNAPPGTATSEESDFSADNDYYFGGLYTTVIAGNGTYTPVGLVSTNEEAFERGFSDADNEQRIHFNLPATLLSNDLLSVTFDALNLDSGGADPRYGVAVYFNNVLVQTQIVIRAAQLGQPITTPKFTLASVNAQVGPGFDNIVSLRGFSYSSQGGGNGIGFDYVKLDPDPKSPFPWSVGTNDNTHLRTVGTGGGARANFWQEGGGVNALPGNPASPEADQQNDNDYYLAGIYTTTIPSLTSFYNQVYTPVGSVVANEGGAERAFAGTDNEKRYHFNLPATLQPTNLLAITWDALDLHVDAALNPDRRYGVEVYFNGILVQTQRVVRPADLNVAQVTAPFTLASVNAQVGPGFDNVVSLRGINYNSTGGGNWMGIDYIKLDPATATPTNVVPQVVFPWGVGRDDNTHITTGSGGGTNANFVQENGTINALPGNPNSPAVNQQADNDYYFAGVYTTIITNNLGTNAPYTPVGTVPVNENAAERAFAGADNALRYHFNLPTNVGPTTLVTVTAEPLDLDNTAGLADPRYGIEIYFNGTLVQTQVVVRAPQLNRPITTAPFTLGSVNARVGSGFDNIVTLKGYNYSTEGGGSWMGIDYVRLDPATNPGPAIVGIGIPGNRAVRAPLATAGGSLRGEYWKRPVWSIATDGSTVASNRVDEQIKRFGSPSGTFSARSFVYLGNDLTPVTNWLAGDGASFVGPTNNLDDAGFRFTGFVNISNAGTVLNIGLNSDDGSRIRIGGVDIIDNDGGHGDQTRDTNITFTAAGLYPIEITYFNGDWTSDNGPGGIPVNHSGNPDPAVHGGANFHLRLNGADITAPGASILHPPSALGPPANIIWVSFHAGDTNPSAAAATAGFTQAPDVGYTELLRAYGHSVTRIVSADNAGLNSNTLNAADLVILSRSAPSGHYQTDAETAFFNGISAPTMVLSGFLIRGGASAAASGNSRLGYMAGDATADVASNVLRLTINSATNPIFAGVELNASNTMINPYAHRVLFTNNLQVGISVVPGAPAGGGTVLATDGVTGDPAFGGMIIGEWQAGATMNTTNNGGPFDILGGRRLVFLTGSRETGGLTAEGSGIYDLDPDGAQMFINAVRYMARTAPAAPLPPYAAAVTADGPIAYYRFNENGTVATNSGTGGAALNGSYVGGAISGTEAPKPPALIGFETNNTALQLNGTNAYVTTISGLLNGRTNFTISGWIRRNGTQNNRTGLWGQNDIIEFGYIDNNTLQLWTDNGLNLTPNPFPDGQWAHIAIVGEGSPGTARMYTNGMLAVTRGHTLPAATAFPFNIGGGGVFDTLAANPNYFNGQIDEVAVFDKALTGAQIATHYFSTIGSPPIITRQPAGTNTFEGANIVLSVGVAGPGPFRYQWLDFGSPIPGQTNATLVFSNASVIQSSTYSVIVSNAFGSVTSADADVLIQAQQPPTITQQPQSITKYAGANATLSVVASGGVNLRYQWQRSSTNVVGATNASLVFPSVQAANAGSYRVIVQNSSGSITSQVATITVITPAAGSYEEGIAALSPIAFWRFNETSGNIAFDSFGNNHATYTNTATNGIVAPRPPQFPGFEANNRAATFDGVSGLVQGPTGLMNGLSNFTMVGWIRRETDQANRTGLFGQNDIVEFGYIDNNTLQLWTDGGLNVTPNPFPNGTWAHVAVVGQGTPGGTARMYTNGVLAVTRTHTLPAANQFTFNIGGGGIFDITGNFFNGQIDELAVFNKALTGTEIQQLYTKAVGQAAQISIAIMRDNIIEDSKPTGTRYEGANFGASWQVRSNYDGVSITRTGVMQFVSTELDQITLAPNTNFNSSAGTIMFWMRSTGTVTTAGDFGAMLFDRRPTNPGGPPGDVIVQTDAGHIFVQAASGSGGVNSFEGTRTVSDNRWHHIAYTYNQAAGGATTVYVDGTLDRSQTNSAPWSWTPTQRIELGRSHDPFWRIYNGFLDDFRIYNRILTPAEIAQVASSDALVDTTALQVRFNFSGPPTGVMLTWPGGVLQRTGGIGPAAVWTDLSNAVSPFILDTRGASNGFFRVRQ